MSDGGRLARKYELTLAQDGVFLRKYELKFAQDDVLIVNMRRNERYGFTSGCVFPREYDVK